MRGHVDADSLIAPSECPCVTSQLFGPEKITRNFVFSEHTIVSNIRFSAQDDPVAIRQSLPKGSGGSGWHPSVRVFLASVQDVVPVPFVIRFFHPSLQENYISKFVVGKMTAWGGCGMPNPTPVAFSNDSQEKEDPFRQSLLPPPKKSPRSGRRFLLAPTGLKFISLQIVVVVRLQK
jgi:hypothetical protein